MHLFEYAVVRAVPRVEREEFINIGVVLFCSELKFLEVGWKIDHDRLGALFPDFDVSELKDYCRAFAAVCKGGEGELESLPLAARFRWLTAKRSTVLQVSPVHPGLCTDPGVTLNDLTRKLLG